MHSLLLKMMLHKRAPYQLCRDWEESIVAITLFVLRTAKCGDPGGVWCNNSEVKAVFAICIHSSRVFRKVSQVDFNRAPISIPLCGKKPMGRHGLTAEQFWATNVYKAHNCYIHDFCLAWIKMQCASCSENWHHVFLGLCPLTTSPLTTKSSVCLCFESNAF